MSAKHEPNAQQIKDEKLYLQMGMTDEEFDACRKNARTSSKLYGNRFIFRIMV